MARLRSNPRRRAVGALLINPKRPRRFKLRALRRMKRRNPKQGVSAYTREKPWTNYPKAKRAKARTSALKRRKGRKARRNPLFVTRANPLFLSARSNPKRRKSRRSRRGRSVARRSYHKTRRTRRARRNPLFLARRNPVFLSRKNPSRRRKSRKGYGALFVRNPGSGLAKIPVVGPILASMTSFVPHSLFGAVSVEPVLFVTQMASPYLPAAMPFSLTVGFGGLLVGALVKRFGPFSASTNDKLATACVAASAGVAYYVWRTGDDAPAAEKMGSLVSAGLGNPLAGAIMGDAGGVYQLPDYGAHAAQPQFVGQAAIPGATRGF